MLGFTSLFCFSSIEDYHRYQLSPTSSNYGETGLLEIPSARFMGEGGLKLGISASYPHEYTYMVASPFSWLEATYRYVEEKNVKYGLLMNVRYSGKYIGEIERKKELKPTHKFLIMEPRKFVEYLKSFQEETIGF